MKNAPGVIFRGTYGNNDDVVYTDSCYYFDPQTAKVMAKVMYLGKREKRPPSKKRD